MTVDKKEDLLDYQHFGNGVLATVIGRQAAPNIVAMIEDLIAHITPPIKLTRKTLTAIVTQTKNRQAALDNPQEFALQAARIIREKAIQQLVDGIQYLKDGTWYDMSEWVEEEETVSDRLVSGGQFHLRPHRRPVRDGEEVCRKVEEDEERALVHKAAAIGSRWGRRSASTTQIGASSWNRCFGDDGPLLYLVRETKSTTVPDDLRGTENQKIHCGERHFTGALGVDYRVVTSADELP